MEEKVFNLFLYIDKGIIIQIGVTVHEITGSKNEKIKFMKKAVNTGLKKNVRFLVPSNFKVNFNGRTIQGVNYDTYLQMCSMGEGNVLFEEIFEHYYVLGIPLTYVTHVINEVVITKPGGCFVTNENMKPVQKKITEKLYA